MTLLDRINALAATFRVLVGVRTAPLVTVTLVPTGPTVAESLAYDLGRLAADLYAAGRLRPARSRR